MAASGFQEIFTEVADSLGYSLKAEQKKPYFPLLMGKTYSSLCLLAMENSCASHYQNIAQEYVHRYAHIAQEYVHSYAHIAQEYVHSYAHIVQEYVHSYAHIAQEYAHSYAHIMQQFLCHI